MIEYIHVLWWFHMFFKLATPKKMPKSVKPGCYRFLLCAFKSAMVGGDVQRMHYDSYAPLYVLGIVAYPQKIVHQLRFLILIVQYHWYHIRYYFISSGLRFKLETDEISHRSRWPAACIHYSDSIGFKMWFKDVTSQMMPDEGSDEVTFNGNFHAQPSEVAKPVDIMKDLVAKQKEKLDSKDLKSAKSRDLSEKPKKHHGVTCPAECGNGWAECGNGWCTSFLLEDNQR